MKTFQQFQEQISSNYTDYKAPEYSGVTIEQVKTGETTFKDGSIESEFTYPDGKKVKVIQTKADRDAADAAHDAAQQDLKKSGKTPLF